MFRSEARTPEEYHTMHIGKWKNAEVRIDNVFIVNYDRLLSDFDEEMRRIAKWVGSDKVSDFLNIPRTGIWVPESNA
jgi:hypothetical protein